MDEDNYRRVSRFTSFAEKLGRLADRPSSFIRESIVEPLRSKNKQYYYHRRFRRVPTIDECYEEDVACIFEANEQFKRDRRVDAQILNILRNRKMECMFYHGPDEKDKCQKVTDDYELASANLFAKYGDLGPLPHVLDAYMKQKHRMVWERQNKKSLITGELLELES